MVFTEIIKVTFDKEYKDSTITTMTNTIKRVMRESGGYDGIQLFDKKYITKHKDAIINFLKANNQSSVTQTVIRVMELLKFPKKAIGELVAIKNQQQADRNIDYMTKQEEDEEESLYDWNELMELQTKFEGEYEANKDDLKYNIKYLFLSLIKYSEPLRSQNYTDTILVDKNPRNSKENFLNINTGLLRLVDYKTSGKYGTQDIILKPELMKIIKQVNSNIKNKYLIPRVNDANEKQTSQSLGEFLTNFIGVSTSKLRSMYVTEMHRQKLPINTSNMLHSQKTSSTVYNKNTENFIIEKGKVFTPINKGDLVERDGKLYMRS